MTSSPTSRPSSSPRLRRGSSRALLAACALGAVAAAAAACAGQAAAAAGHPLTAADAAAGALRARAARTILLQETGQLHSAEGSGSTIDERGHATGTYDCAIVVHLTIVSANRVSATFTVSPRGGSISGRGSARFATQGRYGYFGGTIAISHGSGTFAHAAGADIGISGKINRETLSLLVHVHGTLHA